MDTAVVILNWNGEKYLKEYLPYFIKYSKNIADIYVIDNNSNDNSEKLIKDNFPEVKIIKLEKNYGFAGGYNRGLKKINSKYYVIVNSDIKVTKNYLIHLIDAIKDKEDVVACQPKIKNLNKTKYFEYAGAAGGFIDSLGYPFCRGRIFDNVEKDTGQYDNDCEIFWASGACMIIKADKFWQVGGFDEYFFAHMEEIDLCWRLKKLNYKIMFSHKSEVFHLGGGTLPYLNPKKVYLNHRNALVMLYKNLDKNKFFIILIRLILDFATAIYQFINSKNIKIIFAIIKAHFAFYNYLLKHKKIERSLSNFNKTGIYNGSIVLKYFFGNKKTFLKLQKK